MKKVNAVKNSEAEIDWAAEFGEDDEFTVDPTPGHGDEEEEEVEIVLKPSNREANGTTTSSSLGNGKIASPTYSMPTVSTAARAPMSIGKGSRAQNEPASPSPSSVASTQMASSMTSTLSSSAPYSPSSSMTSSTTTHHFEPPMPRIDLDAHHVVSPSPYNAYLEIRTMAATIKIIAIVHLMLCLVYILMPPFKWMIVPNIVVAAVGLWGAYVYNARLTVAFMTLVCINVILLIVFMLIDVLDNTIPNSIVVIGILCLIGEIFIMNYCYQFWKKLPSEGFFTSFRQFFSSNESRIGGFVMTDEEEGL